MTTVETGVIDTRIPSRLDRLPWSRFHWRIIFGLGTAWVLDGLEVTIVGAVASRLTESHSGIHITAAGIGVAAALYVVGACTGALVFGQLTDRFGRKKLFMITLGLYMAATAVTAVSFSPVFFFIFRFLTGMGIGGEYAAINSAIDELIPARARGRVDLVINGAYWLGSVAGSAMAIFFLNEAIFPADIGWRLTFAIGVILGAIVLVVRRHVPESPRWLFIHGREDEAERIVDRIESAVAAETDVQLEPVRKTLTVRQRRTIGFWEITKTAVRRYPRRSILCLALFVGQAFIYNGITFNLGTLMSTFFHVSSGVVPVFLIIYAASNFLGPVLLGRLFDTVGRVPMIAGTYIGSAVLGLLLAGLFSQPGLLGPWTFILVLIGTFFLASAGASAAYLTASEIFPMETRALAIAFFYAIGTAVGGIVGPLLFGPLIATGVLGLVAVAFVIGSALMGAGGVVELLFGVRAERAQLEDIAKPLTAAQAEQERDGDRPSGARGEGVAAATGDGATPNRLRAADERARAAEHRASAHMHLAAAARGDGEAEARAQAEEVLAQISDLTALAEDERALAAEERSRWAPMGVQADGGDGAADPAGGSGAAARHRAVAAEQRALSHEEEARALADDGHGAEHHRALAAAALERARRHEQLALAVEARAVTGGQSDDGARSGSDEQDAGTGGDPAQGGKGPPTQEMGDRVRMHEAWAEMHAARALVHEHQANGADDSAVADAERAAQAAAALAQAAAYRVEADEYRAEVGGHEDRLEEGGRNRAEEEGQLRQRQAERDAMESRIRARLEARRQREGTGIGRYRPGPGRLATPPAVTARRPFPEEALDNEIIAIERALTEHGPTDRRELARLLGARYWGPGVFTVALHQALAEGGIRRVSRTTYAPNEGPGTT